MSKRRSKLAWKASFGVRPHRIQLLQRREHGVIQAAYYDTARQNTVHITLGHRDRELASAWAQNEAELLALGVTVQVRPELLTVGALLDLYLAHQTPSKVKTEQKADERRARMWKYLYGSTPVRVMAREQWETFIRQRLSGEINAKGVWIGEHKRKPVRARTPDADLVFLDGVFNWATGWKVQGRAILRENPWGGNRPGVKRSLQRPREKAPRRPIVTHDWVLAVRAQAPHVRCTVKNKPQLTPLPTILDLLNETGRRVTAICRLWYSDLVWGMVERPDRTKRQGIVAVRWRPFKDEDQSIIPLSDDVRPLLESYVRAHPGFGDMPLFPAPRKPNVSVGKRTVTDWALKAIELAEVPRPLGSLFHCFRRKWTTERKHHPIGDVAKASGRRDLRTVQEVYTLTDDATILAVVNEPRKLISQGA